VSDPFSTEHVDWQPGTLGPASGFFQGVGAGYEQQYEVNSMYGLEDEVYDRWQKSLSTLETASGQRYEMPLAHRDINNYIAAVEGKDPSVFYQAITLHGFDPTELRKNREGFQRANEAIKALNNPAIPSMEAIVQQVKQHRKEVEERAGIVSQTGGFGTAVGQFIGGVGGSFSGRDPMNILSLPVGGFGKTAAMRIATEMGVLGGLTAVQQYGAVEPDRDLLGEAPGSPLQNIIYAMVGAGLFRGGAEAIGGLIGRANARVAGRIADEEALANRSWEVNSAKLKEVFEENIQSPAARAGIHFLDANEHFDELNPYGDTEVGARQFIADAENVKATMNGEPAPDLVVQNPLDINEQKAAVREVAPELVDRMEQAEARLAEIDRRIEAHQTESGDTSVADAIERVDPEQGAAARVLEQQLNDPTLSPAEQNSASMKLGEIIATLGGPKRIAEESKAAHASSKAELGALRKERRGINKELKQAREDFNNSLKEIQAGQQIKPMTEKADPQFDPSRNRADVVDTRTKEIDEAHEALDENSESAAASMDNEKGVDIGNGVIVDKDFQFTDPDNPEKSISASVLAKQIYDDEALLRAMKECSL